MFFAIIDLCKCKYTMDLYWSVLGMSGNFKQVKVFALPGPIFNLQNLFSCRHFYANLTEKSQIYLFVVPNDIMPNT